MSRRRLVAVAAVAALLAGGGLAAHALGHHRAAAAAPPAALPGTRLVGVGRVVVAVPDSWIDYQAVCSTPAAPYVEFEPLAVEFCGRDSDPYDSARQMRLDLSRLSDWPVGQEPTQGRDCPRPRLGWCRAVWRVAGEDVALSVDYRPDDPAMVAAMERIKASTRVLPAGWTTVPQVYAVTRPGRSSPAGLLRGARLVPGPGAPAGQAVGSEPPAGAVVRSGSTVTLRSTPSVDETYPVPAACAGTTVTLRQAGRSDVHVYPASVYPHGPRLGVGQPLQVVRSGPCAGRIQVRFTGLDPISATVVAPADTAPLELARGFGDLAVTAPGGTYHSTYDVVTHP